MTHHLKSLLDISGPLFVSGLTKLEKTTGNSGIDSRLVANIIEKSHQVMRKLRLDIKDTTGRELYHSLITAVKNDNFESLFLETDYVLTIIDNKIISFNIIDITENSERKLSYEKQIVKNGQDSLKSEIVCRYANHVRTDESTTIDIASSIGLLPEYNACYNNAKAYQRKNKEIKK